jgi:class 3 adenylate cyclase
MARSDVNAERGPGISSKSLDRPDALRPLGRGVGSFVDLGRGLAIGRAVLEPGWRWSTDVKPVVGTRSCLVHHLQLVLAGRLGVRMDSGEEGEFGPNDVIDLPPGHDAWVVGDEPAVIVDMSGNVSDFALPASTARAVLTMLMTDIVDSTRTAGQMGDAAWRQRLGDHNRTVRSQIARFGGREIHPTGDGFLAAFGSAEGALRAALAIRDAVAVLGIGIRAGVHTGEVDVIDGDLRGIAVHETARIMSAATPGSIYTSGLSRALTAAAGLTFESVGVHALKGFDEPVELFSVRERA